MLLQLPDENRAYPPGSANQLLIPACRDFTVSASEVFGVTRGCQLRRLWQGAELRQQHFALAPPYVPSLEPQHPARACRGRSDAEAAQRLHLVHQGRQGLALIASGVPAPSGGNPVLAWTSRTGAATRLAARRPVHLRMNRPFACPEMGRTWSGYGSAEPGTPHGPGAYGALRAGPAPSRRRPVEPQVARDVAPRTGRAPRPRPDAGQGLLATPPRSPSPPRRSATHGPPARSPRPARSRPRWRR